jgi:hypothetical protein
MSSNNTKKLDAIDNLLLVILAASFVIPSIMLAYGLDSRLVWLPTICYVVWSAFTGYFKPRISFFDSSERSIIERIRGWSFVLGLPVVLSINFFLLYVFPKTIIFFTAGTILCALVLFAITAIFPRKLFKKELNSMEKNQVTLMYRMLIATGESTISVSFAILLLTELSMSLSFSLGNTLLTLGIGSWFLIMSFLCSSSSSHIAKNLEKSLRGSKWSKKYSRKLVRKDVVP